MTATRISSPIADVLVVRLPPDLAEQDVIAAGRDVGVRLPAEAVADRRAAR